MRFSSSLRPVLGPGTRSIRLVLPAPDQVSAPGPIAFRPCFYSARVVDLVLFAAVGIEPALRPVQQVTAIDGGGSTPGGSDFPVGIALLRTNRRPLRCHRTIGFSRVQVVGRQNPGLVELEVQRRVIHARDQVDDAVGSLARRGVAKCWSTVSDIPAGGKFGYAERIDQFRQYFGLM